MKNEFGIEVQSTAEPKKRLDFNNLCYVFFVPIAFYMFLTATFTMVLFMGIHVVRGNIIIGLNPPVFVGHLRP